MNDDDFNNFSQSWASAYESCSRGKLPSSGATNLAFEALREYPLAEINKALTSHVRSPNSRFGLVPADVVEQIDGPTPNVDQIIGAAMRPDTPLAALCRVEIGVFNLENWDMKLLKPLAERCIMKLPEWRKKLAAGDLTDRQNRELEKYGLQAGGVRRLSHGGGA